MDNGVELPGKVVDVASALLKSEYVSNVVGIVVNVVGSEVSIGIGGSLGEPENVAVSGEVKGAFNDKFGAISEISISFVSMGSSRTGVCSAELAIEGSDSVKGKLRTSASDFDKVVGHVGNKLVEHFDASGDVFGHCDGSTVVVENFVSSFGVVEQFGAPFGVVEHLDTSTIVVVFSDSSSRVVELLNPSFRVVLFSDSSTRVIELLKGSSRVFEHFATSARDVGQIESSIRGVGHFEFSIKVEHFDSSTRIVEQFGLSIVDVEHFAASSIVFELFAASSRVVERFSDDIFAHCITVACKEIILRIKVLILKQVVNSEMW